MAPTWFKLVIVIAVIVVLFGGRGRISDMMGDLAKGIKSFKSGLKDDDDETAALPNAAGDDAERLSASRPARETASAG